MKRQKAERFVVVFGAPAAAEAGQLVCVVAGSAAQTAKVLPYCKGVMGKANIDLSDQPPGKASLLKLVGNTFIINMVESLAEGHTLAEKSGLGMENLHQFIENVFPGPYTAYSQRLMSGDYYKREEVKPYNFACQLFIRLTAYQPLFAAPLARKDARHALDLAKSSGTRLKDIEIADEHLAAAEKHMGSKADMTGIYGVVRQEANMKFEN